MMSFAEMAMTRANRATNPIRWTRPSFSDGIRLPPRIHSMNTNREPSAVQHRYGQDVQNRQVDAQQDCHEHPPLEPALTGHLSGNLGDADGPAQLRPASAAEPAADLPPHQGQHVPGASDPQTRGGPGRFNLPDLLLVHDGKGDPDRPLTRRRVHPGRHLGHPLLPVPFDDPGHLGSSRQPDLPGAALAACPAAGRPPAPRGHRAAGPRPPPVNWARPT